MPSFVHAHRGIIRKTADHRAPTYRSLEWLVKLLPTQLEYCTLRGQTTLVGDVEEWILIGWMCHMTMSGIHAYLQYGDVMTSRSKGIGQWKHHVLGSPKICEFKYIYMINSYNVAKHDIYSSKDTLIF